MDIIQDFIPEGRKNRPGFLMQPEYITVHDTGNPAAYADAEAHAAYLQTETAAKKPVSWHFTVDGGCCEKLPQVYQHLPLNEVGYHAGDGNGPGNMFSIGIEICENIDGDREKAEKNAARLAAFLVQKFNLPLSAVVQHFKWTGKDCPRVLRNRPGGWEGFLKTVEEEIKPFPDVDHKHWAFKEIVWAKSKGILVGTKEGNFEPDAPMTRAQCAVAMQKLYDLIIREY